MAAELNIDMLDVARSLTGALSEFQQCLTKSYLTHTASFLHQFGSPSERIWHQCQWSEAEWVLSSIQLGAYSTGVDRPFGSDAGWNQWLSDQNTVKMCSLPRCWQPLVVSSTRCLQRRQCTTQPREDASALAGLSMKEDFIGVKAALLCGFLNASDGLHPSQLCGYPSVLRKMVW